MKTRKHPPRTGKRTPSNLAADPGPAPRYRLQELLAQCNPKSKRCKIEDEWLRIQPVGRELI